MPYKFNPFTGTFDDSTPGPAGVVAAANSGTALLPGITFASDPNTGIYNPGADQLAVATNGVGRLFVGASGNVGIGISAARTLDVNGTSYFRGAVDFFNSAGGAVTSSKLIFGSAALPSAASIFSQTETGTAGNLQLQTAQTGTGTLTERMRIDSSGRVGIGTSSPSNTAGFGQQLQLTGNLPCITIDNTGTGPNKYSLGVNASAAFGIWDNTASAYRMYINSSGSIGIGTTSPLSRLHVEDSGEPIIYIRRDTTSATSLGGPIWRNNGFNVASIITQNLNSNSADLTFSTSSGGSLSERVRLTSDGKFLVGTSSVSNSNVTFAIQGSPASPTNGPQFLMKKNVATPDDGDSLGSIAWGDNTDTVSAGITGRRDGGTWSASSKPSRLEFSTTADGAATPTERMRIDSAGNTRFNSASGSATADPGVKIVSSATIPEVRTVVNTADGGITNYSYYNTNATYNGYRFYVKVDGGVANHSVNNVNLSDRNVKKDVSPAADTWDCIKEWEIVNYRYKDQPNTTALNLGVIAQQVAESCPEVITVFEEAKDDQPEKLGVKEQQMYWMAIKALQEAQARIEALEADVAQLKGA